jgi:predicted Rossmann-fold nucleotide-binding protein
LIKNEKDYSFAVQVLESIVLSCRKQPSRTNWQRIKLNLFMAANVGLMGAVADGVLNGGGTVIGVIPDFKIKRNRSQWIDGTNCRR